MKWELALLTLCAFASAMVPRERRAVDSEELGKTGTAGGGEAPTSTTGAPEITYCQKSTPCGWIFYKENDRTPQDTIKNTFCECSEGLACQVDEDDQATFVLVKKCKPPGKASINIES